MNSSVSAGPSLNVLLLWFFIVVSILLSIFLIGRTLFSTQPVTDPDDIPDSVYQKIADSLQESFDFIGYTDDGGIEKLDGITFQNNLRLTADSGCGMTMAFNNCDCDAVAQLSHIFLQPAPDSNTNAIKDDTPQPFLFKFTGNGSDTCQLPIPGDRCTAIMKCKNKDNCGGEGKQISWEYCPD